MPTAQQAAAAGPNGASMPAGPPPITSTPQAGPPPEVKSYGPFLRFGGYDPISHAYYASVLVVAHQSKSSAQPPSVRFRDVDVPKSETVVKAQHLEHYRGFNAWRWVEGQGALMPGGG